MNTFFFNLVVGFITCSISIVIIFYSKINLILQNKKHLSIRRLATEKVSEMGGICIVLSFFCTLFLSRFLIEKTNFASQNPLFGVGNVLIPFLIGGAGIACIGFIDDLFNIRARYKFIGQIICTFPYLFFGYGIHSIDLPVYGLYPLGNLSLLFTLFWIVACINAVNLIDGLDGLAAGVGIIALIFLTIVGVLKSYFTIISVSGILIGVYSGFLLFNRPKATIFMGDTGSLFLGYCLAILPLLNNVKGNFYPFSLLTAVILGLPLLDTAFAFIRRYLQGVPFYSADKNHLHHRLTAKGNTTSRAVIKLYSFAIGFGSIALIGTYFPNLYLFMMLISLLFAYAILVYLEYDEIRKPLQIIKNKTSLKKNRTFVHTLTENIDIFFEKDESIDDLLKSFKFWAKQMKVVSYRIKDQNTIKSEFHSPAQHDYYEITYTKNIFQIHLTLHVKEFHLDSDVKSQLIDDAILSLIHHLSKFYSPTKQDFMQSSQEFKKTIQRVYV